MYAAQHLNKNGQLHLHKVPDETSLPLQENEHATPAAPAKAGGGAAAFSFTDVQECAEEYGIDLSERQLKNFYNMMTDFNWTLNGYPVKRLENALSGYAKKHSRKDTETDGAADTEEDQDAEEVEAGYNPHDF